MTEIPWKLYKIVLRNTMAHLRLTLCCLYNHKRKMFIFRSDSFESWWVFYIVYVFLPCMESYKNLKKRKSQLDSRVCVRSALNLWTETVQQLKHFSSCHDSASVTISTLLPLSIHSYYLPACVSAVVPTAIPLPSFYTTWTHRDPTI